MLAVFLGTLKIVARGGHGLRVPDAPEFAFIMLCVCGAAVVGSALVLPICLWVCFGASAIGVRIIALAGYLVAVAAIALGVAAKVAYKVPAEEIYFVLLLHAALLAVLFSGLGLARACGYVLISVRSTRRRQANSEIASGFRSS